MNVKQVWMSPVSGKQNAYALRLLGSIAGIVALMMLLIWGGVELSFRMNLPREVFSLALCIGVTLLAVGLSVWVGQRSLREATVFFLTEDDRLYAMDTRQLSERGHNVWDYAAGAAQTQAFLRRLAQKPVVPAGAEEIRKVKRIRGTPMGYTIVCQVRRPNRRILRRTYFLGKGWEAESLLLLQLERREHWETAWEPASSRKLLAIGICALIFVVCAAVCVLSHPAQGKLPPALYYPCLAAAFLAFCWGLNLALQLYRGD